MADSGAREDMDALAIRLPEAEALPDGFTEGDDAAAASESRAFHEDSLAAQLPESEALPDGFSEVSDELHAPDSSKPAQTGKENLINTASQVEEASAFFSQLGISSPSRRGQMVDDVAVSREMRDFTVDLRADKVVEKTRRFPVPLSDTSTDSSSLSLSSNSNRVEGSGIQNQSGQHLSSLLALDSSTANLKAGGFDGRISESVKARKRRMKEVKLLLDSAEKTTDEKLQILHQKFLQQVVDTEHLERELTAVRHRLYEENAERIALSADLNKSSLLRQKLESLCRELQRQNKILLDESKKIAAEEQQRRQELSTKFHNTIREISLKLDEQGDDRIRQVKENEILREKLKHFTQQYEIREEHFSHQLRTKTLEQQLLEVKLKQQQELFLQEEAKARTYTEQISQLLVTEQDLRSQLALYGDKFEQFQDTLTKSNEVFASFKQEMEKMSKTIKVLEKENLSLKKKCQNSDVSLIELLDERSALKKQLETTGNQKNKLEALCRILQAERKQQSQTPDSPSPEPLQEESITRVQADKTIDIHANQISSP